MHSPAVHVSPLAHAVLQPPQWPTSVCSSTHPVVAPQYERPVGQAHAPFEHPVELALQTLPQAPQWVGVVCRSTHVAELPLPQRVWPVGQTQWPDVHELPPTHLTPQAPQLLLSMLVFVH
jgi:hypothetical protein